MLIRPKHEEKNTSKPPLLRGEQTYGGWIKLLDKISKLIQ